MYFGQAWTKDLSQPKHKGMMVSMPEIKNKSFETLLPWLVFCSGATGLIYESLWMRSFGLIFGNTTYAISVILATFMGGLTLGNWLITRWSFKKNLSAYAIVEGVIGATALLTLPLLHYLPEWWGAFLQKNKLSVPVEMILRTILASLVILPTTLMLGATIPLLMEYLARLKKNVHDSLGRLYRLNTLGGAAGAFLAPFVFYPALGLSKTFILAVLINLVIGITAWRYSYNEVSTPSPPPPSPTRKITLPLLFILLAFTSGAASFGLEILWTRSYSLIIGSSVYSFNLMLVSFLLGIVFGTLLYEHFWPRIQKPALWLSGSFVTLGVLILLNVALIGLLPEVYFIFMKMFPVSFGIYQAVGFVMCFLSMLMITTLFGFGFPLITHLLKQENFSARESTGLLYAWNTLGAITGASVSGFALIPFFGLQTSYVWVAGLLVLVGLLVLGKTLDWGVPSKSAALFITGILLWIMGISYKPWDKHMMTSGIYKYGVEWRENVPPGMSLKRKLKEIHQILFYKESREGVVSVTQSGPDRFIAVNGKIDAGNSRDVITQKLIAHVPLALHPNPKKVLIIGWGSGSTAGSTGRHPVEQIHLVEIEPAMFEAGDFFSELNFGIARDPRFKVIFNDARNVMLTTPEKYDCILSEPSNPWMTGVSNLFTSDFYRIAIKRLTENGIFCQWFHYYNMTLQDIKVQVGTFCKAFPHASLWIIPPPPAKKGMTNLTGDLLLIGSVQPHILDYKRVKQIFELKPVAEDLRSVSINEELDFLCNYLMNKKDMELFGSGVGTNTDDHPWIELKAPRGLYIIKSDAQRIDIEIYQNFDNGGSELIPPIENAPLSKSPKKKELASFYRKLGDLYLKKALLERTTRLYEASLKLDENNASAYAVLGEILYMRKKPKEAEKLLLKALSMDTSLMRPYDILGTIYFNQRDLAKAGRMYQILMKKQPKEAMGYYGQAVIFAEEKNWIQSRDFINRALILNPQMDNAKKLKEFVDRQIR